MNNLREKEVWEKERWDDSVSIVENWGGTRDPLEKVRNLWTGEERFSWGDGKIKLVDA